MANRVPFVEINSRFVTLPSGDQLVDEGGNPIGGSAPGGSTGSVQYNDGAGGFGGLATVTLEDYVDLNIPDDSGPRITIGETTITDDAIGLKVNSGTGDIYFNAYRTMYFNTNEAGTSYFKLSEVDFSEFLAPFDLLFTSLGILQFSGETGIVFLAGDAVDNNTDGAGVDFDCGDSKGTGQSAARIITAVAGSSGGDVRAAAEHFRFEGLTFSIKYDASNLWTSTIGSTGKLTMQGTGTGGSIEISPTSGQNIILKPASTGKVLIGDGTTNYMEVDASGAVKLYGTAKIEHHTQIAANAVLVSGSGFAQYGSSPVAGLLANSNSDLFFFQHEMYQGWDGANIYIEVDWIAATDITNGQTVIWNIAYRSVAENEDIDSFSDKTLSVTYTSTGTTSAGTVKHTRFTLAYNDATAPLTVQDHLFVKVFRDATGDSYNGNCIITAFEIIWFANELSRV